VVVVIVGAGVMGGAGVARAGVVCEALAFWTAAVLGALGHGWDSMASLGMWYGGLWALGFRVWSGWISG
jgi:hypothetical protein